MPQFKSILLVDDDLNDIELVSEAFKRNNITNHIVTARHGGEALDYLFRREAHAGRQDEDPIFILLDLKMPKVDGIEVLRQIKAGRKAEADSDRHAHFFAEEADLLKSYSLGVNAYVVKPVEFAQFIEAIRLVGLFWALINEPPPLAAVVKRP